jgi:hypothetical protein
VVGLGHNQTHGVASAPISIASAASAMRSPAWGPKIVRRFARQIVAHELELATDYLSHVN